LQISALYLTRRQPACFFFRRSLSKQTNARPIPSDRAGKPSFQYIREMTGEGSSERQILGAYLATHLVGLEFEVDLLAFRQTGQTGSFDRADVDEHVVSAIVRLNEAKSLLAVEPLNCTDSHYFFSFMSKITRYHDCQSNARSSFGPY
jgi:hypothetical protein